MTYRTLTLSCVALLSLTACQSAKPYAQDEAPRRQFNTIEARMRGEQQFAVYDPIESTNKHIYKFNAKFDDYVYIPLVNGYKAVTPEFIRQRVSNFFLNVGEVRNFTNATLQAKPKKAAITVGRFAVNTTVGLLGTFDVASKMKLERQSEDFGQTLGHYNTGPGAYVVLPLFGPSNVRDATGKIVDFAFLSFLIPNDVEDTLAYQAVAYGIQPVDARYRNNFRYFQSGSPFEYELVRYIVTQGRKLEIAK